MANEKFLWVDNGINTTIPIARVNAGANENMEMTTLLSLTSYTIFFVVSFDNVSNSSLLGNQAANVNLIRLSSSTTFLTRGVEASAETITSDTTVATSTWYLMSFTFDGPTQVLHINGGLAGTNSADGNTTYAFDQVGLRFNLEPFDGDFAAIKVYDGAMVDAQRKAVEEFYRVKYALNISAQTTSLKYPANPIFPNFKN